MNTVPLRRFRTFGAAVAASVFCAACLNVDASSGEIAALTIVSGSNQTVPRGTASTVPLVVRALDASAAPLPNQTVTWAVPRGNGTVSAATTITDQFGQASVLYTAGNSVGPVSVTATAEGLTVTFQLAVS